jgi:hypothetical protein
MWASHHMGITGVFLLEKYAKQAKVIHFENDPAGVHKSVHCRYRVLGVLKHGNITLRLERTYHCGNRI